MAMPGVSDHGTRPASAPIIANAPQKKIRTAADTQIFSAGRNPMSVPKWLRHTSNKMLFHCLAIQRPGASPRGINCASHALYVWLARSPASILLCQKQGIRTAAEMADTRNAFCRRKSPQDESADAENVKFSECGAPTGASEFFNVSSGGLGSCASIC